MAAGTCYYDSWPILWPFNILYASAQKHVDYLFLSGHNHYINNKHGEIPMTKVLMRSGKIGWLYQIREFETEIRYYLIIDRNPEKYWTPKGKLPPFDIIEIDEA